MRSISARAELSENHAHRHLGFADADLSRWCRKAGIEVADITHLKGKPLTVTLWLGCKPGTAAQMNPAPRQRRTADKRVTA